eukprot:TRINITY_DN9446_c0_g1_i1.p1 TRINITY_DN9446_c0_g1~~TRINITY_DN9446_c0_g1_i1.p1  ORF type:complete len:332 (-),score=93.31 TRINITY_DN9446_c0_g1_i1:18-1013(-)
MTTVYVTNIAEQASLQDVQKLFNMCGSVSSLDMVDSFQNAPRKVARVVFDSPKSVDTALLFTKTMLLGVPIDVSLARIPEFLEPQGGIHAFEEPVLPTVPSISGDGLVNITEHMLNFILYIEGISADVEDLLFLEYFEFCGEIQSYSIDRDSGVALVEYSQNSPNAVKIGFHLNGGVIGNNRITAVTLGIFAKEGINSVLEKLLNSLSPPPQVEQEFIGNSPPPALPSRSTQNASPPPLPKRDNTQPEPSAPNVYGRPNPTAPPLPASSDFLIYEEYNASHNASPVPSNVVVYDTSSDSEEIQSYRRTVGDRFSDEDDPYGVPDDFDEIPL